MLCPAWLGLPWAPRAVLKGKPLAVLPTWGWLERGETLSGCGGLRGVSEGLPSLPTWHSEGQLRASHAMGGRFGVVWFGLVGFGLQGFASRGRGLSHGPGVCAGRRRRSRMPSKERGPARAPAPLKSLPTSNVTAGTPGAFPELVSPVRSCCDVPSFLLSLSL